jgi:hypothetical protein
MYQLLTWDMVGQDGKDVEGSGHVLFEGTVKLWKSLNRTVRPLLRLKPAPTTCKSNTLPQCGFSFMFMYLISISTAQIIMLYSITCPKGLRKITKTCQNKQFPGLDLNLRTQATQLQCLVSVIASLSYHVIYTALYNKDKPVVCEQWGIRFTKSKCFDH